MLLWTLLARKLRIWAHKAITHDLEPQLHLLITLNPPGNPKLNVFYQIYPNKIQSGIVIQFLEFYVFLTQFLKPNYSK